MIRQSRQNDICLARLLEYADSVGANDKIRKLVSEPWDLNGAIAEFVSGHLHVVGTPSEIKDAERQVTCTLRSRGRVTSYYSVDDKVRLLLLLLMGSSMWLKHYPRASSLPPMIRECMAVWNRASLFPFFDWLQKENKELTTGFEQTIQSLGRSALGSVLHRATLESLYDTATLGYAWLVETLECSIFLLRHHTWAERVLRARAPRDTPTARQAQERMEDCPLVVVQASRIAGGAQEFERELAKANAWDEICRLRAFTQERGHQCDVHVLDDGAVGTLIGKGDWLNSDYVDNTSGRRRSYYVCPSTAAWDKLRWQSLSQLPTHRVGATSMLIAGDVLSLAPCAPDGVWTWLARHYLLPPAAQSEFKISGDGHAMLRSIELYISCFPTTLQDEFKRSGRDGMVKLARRIALPLALSILPVVSVPLTSIGAEITESASIDSDKLLVLLCELGSSPQTRPQVGKLLSAINLPKQERPAPPALWSTPVLSGHEALKELITIGRGTRTATEHGMMLFFSALEAGVRKDAEGGTDTKTAVPSGAGAPLVARRTRVIRPLNLPQPSSIVFQQMSSIVASTATAPMPMQQQQQPRKHRVQLVSAGSRKRQRSPDRRERASKRQRNEEKKEEGERPKEEENENMTVAVTEDQEEQPAESSADGHEPT